MITLHFCSWEVLHVDARYMLMLTFVAPCCCPRAAATCLVRMAALLVFNVLHDSMKQKYKSGQVGHQWDVRSHFLQGSPQANVRCVGPGWNHL